MWTWMSPVSFFCCLLTIAVIGTPIAYAEPEPMARPTRPKVITSPEELKRYLDLVRDYYSLNGRARYGKRGDAAPISELNATWETLKMMLDAQRQNQQRKQEKIRQNKEQILLRDFQNSNVNKHSPRVAAQPGYFLDVIGKYYDDLQ